MSAPDRIYIDRADEGLTGAYWRKPHQGAYVGFVRRDKYLDLLNALFTVKEEIERNNPAEALKVATDALERR